MKSAGFFLSGLALLMVALPSQKAMAATYCNPLVGAICAGKECPPVDVGRFFMDGDKTTLVACLLEKAENPRTVWKTITGSSSSTTSSSLYTPVPTPSSSSSQPASSSSSYPINHQPVSVLIMGDEPYAGTTCEAMTDNKGRPYMRAKLVGYKEPPGGATWSQTEILSTNDGYCMVSPRGLSSGRAPGQPCLADNSGKKANCSFTGQLVPW